MGSNLGPSHPPFFLTKWCFPKSVLPWNSSSTRQPTPEQQANGVASRVQALVREGGRGSAPRRQCSQASWPNKALSPGLDLFLDSLPFPPAPDLKVFQMNCLSPSQNAPHSLQSNSFQTWGPQAYSCQASRITEPILCLLSVSCILYGLAGPPKCPVSSFY